MSSQRPFERAKKRTCFSKKSEEILYISPSLWYNYSHKGGELLCLKRVRNRIDVYRSLKLFCSKASRKKLNCVKK